MEKKSIMWLKIACYSALVCLILWAAFYCIQGYFILTTGSGEGVIDWSDAHVGIKVSYFLLSRAIVLAIAGIAVAFVVNILKYIRGGQIFNRKNVALLWALVVLVPIHTFFNDNLGYVVTPDIYWHFILTSNTLMYNVVVLLVALLYKLAYDAAREQELTI